MVDNGLEAFFCKEAFVDICGPIYRLFKKTNFISHTSCKDKVNNVTNDF